MTSPETKPRPKPKPKSKSKPKAESKRRTCDGCNQCCPHTELTFAQEFSTEEELYEVNERYGKFNHEFVLGTAIIRDQRNNVLREIGSIDKPCPMMYVVKGMHDPCPYQNPDVPGCLIYENRPEPCRAFECEWLLGRLPHQYHPNRTGAIVYEEKYGDALSCPVFIICNPNTKAWKLGKSLLKKVFAESQLVIVVRSRADRKIYCTPKDWRIFRHRIHAVEEVDLKTLDSCWRNKP